ncbi:hypothetical protein L798_01947 [Zootermopsis nevadensis]|uniref:Uncharacterized protein n=1 Tax=Zootermopsis nevadensis TaxID=136037 RepID=A0A067QK81_ZOONE|nr:hypothetical protein L798_01947 [Zootermopsis nevadensis]
MLTIRKMKAHPFDHGASVTGIHVQKSKFITTINSEEKHASFKNINGTNECTI